jgi:hypothetical protein
MHVAVTEGAAREAARRVDHDISRNVASRIAEGEDARLIEGDTVAFDVTVFAPDSRPDDGVLDARDLPHGPTVAAHPVA